MKSEDHEEVNKIPLQEVASVADIIHDIEMAYQKLSPKRTCTFPHCKKEAEWLCDFHKEIVTNLLPKSSAVVIS